MLSQLLNPEQRPPEQHFDPSPTDRPSAASSRPPSPSHSSMAGSTMTMPVGVTMQTQDEHRPDLPRPYKCPLCDKAFHRLEHQTRHIRTHTGEKPHACQFPGCTKRFSRSDELTRHSRIHNNPNSRRGNKQHAAAAVAVAAVQAGVYDGPGLQQIHQIGPQNQIHQHQHVSQLPPLNRLGQTSQPSQINSLLNHSTSGHVNPLVSPRQQLQQMSPPPPPRSVPNASQSAPTSQLNSPNVSPPHSYATYSSTPGSYLTRNTSGDLSLAAAAGSHAHARPMDINLLATAASQVERENNSHQPPNQHLSLPSRHSFFSHSHHHPYHTGRMPSLSSYHYSSNPTSQPMSRSHSCDEEDRRPTKKSRPGSPQSTAPPSPSFSHASASPTPDHTPLATPSHSPRLRPQFFHSGVHLPTLHHLSLAHQPPPALAPVEPSADGSHPYIPVQHSGLRISEIMEAGDGAQRKLPIPMVAGTKDPGYTVRELRNLDSGLYSGQSSARVSEAGNDLHERM